LEYLAPADAWLTGGRIISLCFSLYSRGETEKLRLVPFWKWLARTGAPIAAILIPAAFFLSVLSPSA